MTSGELLNQQLERIREANDRNLEILNGIVLPEADSIRKETVFPAVPEETIAALYENMGSLGFGREDDVTLAEAGMDGATVALEGGRLITKVRAELIAATRSNHGYIVFTATDVRKLDAEEKKELGLPPEDQTTELGGVPLLLEYMKAMGEIEYTANTPGGIGIPFSYGVSVNEKVITNNKGKEEYIYTYDIVPGGGGSLAKSIGIVDGQPAFVVEVAQQDHIDKNKSEGEKGYKAFKRPNAGELARLIREMFAIIGIDEDRIATGTAGIYVPTRLAENCVVNAQLAKEGNPLVVGVVAYGRSTMNGVTGKPQNRPPKEQLLSEVSRLTYVLKEIEAKRLA